MADDRVYCFNPSCPQGTDKHYSQRGISAHLSHSAECQEYVSYNNVHQSSASRPSFISVHGHLDTSTTHALSTGVTLAHSNHPKRPRLLLNKAYPHTPGNEVELPVTIPQPYVDPMEHIGFAFHEDDEAASTPTISSSTSQRCMVKLMKILEDMSAPDYALELIIDWAQASLADGFDFAPKNKTRTGNLANIYNAVHNSTLLLPSVISVPLLEHHRPVDVIVYDFVPQFLSLLQDPSLMQGPNLNLDPANPFARYQSPDLVLGEMHSGSVYNKMYNTLITDPKRQLLVPIILYFDKSHVTNGSNRFGLEPGSFSLSLFTEQTRRRTDAWRMLGFIHQVLKSSAENAALQADTNVNNYHRQLRVLLHVIAQVQAGLDKRLQNVTLTIDEHTFQCDLVVPIMCVITDTPAANIVCGHYNGASAELSRPHRACDCSHKQLDDPDRKCVFVEAADIFELMASGTAADQKAYSIKPVINHAFAKLLIGDPVYSIFGATLTDIMHAVRQGTLRRGNLLLFCCLSAKGKKLLDTYSRQFHRDHRQSERKNFPRASFVNGITTMSQISAEEQAGIVFILCCMLQQEEVWELFDVSLKRHQLLVADVLELLECLLCFDAWTRQPSFWVAGDIMAARRADDAISTLIDMIVSRLPREKGHGWKVPTLHSLKHLVREIESNGAPCNFMAEVPEHNHIRFAKRPGRASKKDNETFERQAATRIADSMMIARAHTLYFPNDGDTTPVTLDEDVAYGGGTQFTIMPPIGRLPPTVLWNTTTSANFLELPLGLPAFVMTHYQRTTEMVLQTEYTGGAAGTVRCHPGYRGGASWYDWVEVAGHEGRSDDIPFKVLAVVPVRDPGSDVIRFELIGWPGVKRTKKDSVVFTEWTYAPNFSVIRAETIVRRSFAVKVAPKVVAIVCPVEEWPFYFAH